MEDSKKIKTDGIKKYEKFILEVCNVEYFSLLTDEEKNGYYGVAMLLAYQEGVTPNLKDFSAFLRVTPVLLEEPFNILRANGIFNPIYRRKEKATEGLDIDNNYFSSMEMDNKKKTLIDYCWVAGVATGLCGLK